MSQKVPMGKLANWNPGPGGTTPNDYNRKLMSTEASDNKESISGTNEQKEFMNSGGRPKGPFGLRGKEF